MNGKVLYIALTAALVALFLFAIRSTDRIDQAVKRETAFERVMRTHTIRCGYAMWDPVLYKDIKTGEIRGIAHDLMEDIGKKLDLHIDWAEETGWGTLVEGLATGRYDAICVALGEVAARAKSIGFTTPLFYAPSVIAVRSDETRITKNDDLNNPAYSFAVLEGEAASFLVPKKFPKAQLKPLPQNADYSLVFQDVVDKKADATVVTTSDFEEYDKSNPGKMKILDKGAPIQLYAVAFGLPQGDVAFKTMMDAAIGELMSDGTVEETVHAYTLSPQSFAMPARPYAAFANP